MRICLLPLSFRLGDHKAPAHIFLSVLMLLLLRERGDL